MRKPFNHFKKQIVLCAILLSAAASPGFAQVKGISYTISPTGEYVFWNKNTGISDGFLVGGHLGFGFGEFIELRGTYLQDVGNLTRNFGNLNSSLLRNAKLDSFNIGVTRWGGDIKLNLSRGSLVPYLTIGTGVQTLSPDTLAKYKNIYVAAGAGFQLSGGDRYTFNVQAVNTAFNASPVRSLTSAAERTANNFALADYPNDMLRNWSVRASLNLYLGGRRPGELTEVDKAVLNNFSSGISLPIEVTAGQLDFGKGSPYTNTRYAGVATGLNFGPYVGLRAFYWRGLEDSFTSKFTKLALYGGEGKFKLGNGQGLTPALLLGGGVIDAMKGYQSDSTAEPLAKKGFVSGGVGLDFPLGRALKLTAYGKALLTSNDSIQNTVSPDQLTTSFAYGLSLNLLIGNGTKDIETQKEKSYDELVMNTMKRERNRGEDLKDDLDKRIDRLDDQIKDARKNDDRRMAYDLEDEQDNLRKQVKKVDELLEKEEDANKEASKKKDGLLMKMKPTEFSNELDDIEDEVGRGRRNNSSGSNDRMNSNDRSNRNDRNQRNNSDDEGIRALEDRLKSIEQKLDDIQRNNQQMRQNRTDNGNYDNNRNFQNYPNGDYRNGNNQNYDDRNDNNRNNSNNNSRNGNYDDRNYNNRDNSNNNSRNGNYDDRNSNGQNNNNSRNGNYDDRNDNNRNNNSRNQNYDDRNNNDRNNNRGNNDDDYRSNQNSNSRDNGNNNARRNFGSNGGNSRNANAQPDTNDKFAQLDAERDNGESLRKAYEDRIDALDKEIDDAKDKGDEKLEEQKKNEKSAMEDGVKQIRDAQDKENRANRKAIRSSNADDIKMSPDDYRKMLDEVQDKNKDYQQDIERSMSKFRKDTRNEMRDMRDDKDAYQQGLEDEMRDLKEQLREMRAGRGGDVKKNDGRDNNGNDRMNNNNDRNDRNARRNVNDDEMNEDSDVFANSSLNNNSAAKTSSYLTEDQQAYEPEMKAQDGFFSVLNYDGASAIAGFNLGGATTLNIGVRNHYRYKNTNFFLMPEAFFGFGASSAFGLFANGIYDFKIKNRDDFSPYAGLGLGLMKIGSSELNNTKVAFNIVLGANLFKIANGRFYVDVSARNFFKYTQLAAGYRLPF